MDVYLDGSDYYLIKLGEGDFNNDNIAIINFVDDGVVGTLYLSKGECDPEISVSDDGSTIYTYYSAFITKDSSGSFYCVDFDTVSSYIDINNIGYEQKSSQSLGFLHIVSLFTIAVLLGGYIMRSIRKLTRW